MYKIEITRIDKDVPFKDREYKKVGTKPDGDDAYDYVYFDSVKDVSTEVYKQVVDNLDLVSVIHAVNKEDNARK